MDKGNERLCFDSVLSHVMTAAAAVFGQPIRPSDNFFDLGGDSVAAVELVVKLSAALGFEPDADTLFFAPDLADFALALTR